MSKLLDDNKQGGGDIEGMSGHITVSTSSAQATAVNSSGRKKVPV